MLVAPLAGNARRGGASEVQAATLPECVVEPLVEQPPAVMAAAMESSSNAFIVRT